MCSYSTSTNGNGTGYVSIGEASKATGLSIKMIRRSVERGKISCKYSPLSNHRLFNLPTLFAETGFATETESAPSGNGVAILVRTSTASKEQKKSIQAQLDRVKTAVSEEYSIPFEEVENQCLVVREHRSAFGVRKLFYEKIVKGIVEGRISSLWISFINRLARDSSKHLIFYLCELFNVEIHVVDEEEEISEQESDYKDLLDVLQYWISKQSGKRGAFSVKKRISTDVLRELIKLHNEGRNIEEIARIAEVRNLRTMKGQKLNSYLVRTALRGKEVALLRESEPELGEGADSSFVQFCKSHLKKSRKKSVYIESSEVQNRYREWARENGAQPISSRQCGAYLRATYKWRHSANSRIAYLLVWK